MEVLLIVLLCVAPLVGYLVFGKGLRQRKAKYAAIGLGLAFCLFAFGHFALTTELVEMLPPWVPERSLIIYAAGALEILIAVGLFTEGWRRPACIAAAVLFVLFFPANIYAALNYTGIGQHETGPGYLWIRVPLQFFLVAWALWPVLAPDRKTEDAGAPRSGDAGDRSSVLQPIK
jgi:uncharacterized membrane protein